MINQDQMLKSCKTFLNMSKNDSDTSVELMINVLGFLITSGEYSIINSNEFNPLSSAYHKKNQSAINSPVFAIFNTCRQISRLCTEIPKLDKNSLRKIARELWDNIVDLYTDQLKSHITTGGPAPGLSAPYDASSSSGFSTPVTQSSIVVSRDQQLIFQNRQNLRKLFLFVKNKQARTLIISILSTLFNIADTQANNEIHNEFRYLWPSALANSQALNLNSLTDLLISVLNDSLDKLNPFQTSWLRTYADILLAKSQLCDSIKFFLKILIVETKYFFRVKGSQGVLGKNVGIVKKTQEELDEKIIKCMIKSCVAMNKHTQAALLCQCLTNTNDYGPAFRYLQDSSILVPSQDEMDMLYSCVWDMGLLEYLANLNYQRGFLNRKNLCLKLISTQSINASNPVEIYQKTVDVKKSILFLKLLEYYFLI